MKKKNLGLALSAILMLVVLVLWFTLPAIKIEVLGKEITYNFMQLAFGHSEKVLGATVEIVLFSFLNFLPLILIVVGVLLPLVMFSQKKGLVNKQVDKIIVLAVAVLVALFAFLVKSFAIPKIDGAFKDYVLAYGVYLVAGVSLLAGVSPIVVPLVVKK